MNKGRMFTEEMVSEIQRCMYDPEYFMHQFLDMNLSDVVDGVDLWFESITQDPKVPMKDAVAFVLWHAIFQPQKTILYLTKTAKQAKEASNTFRAYYDYLPEWLKVELINKSIPMFRFLNGSNVFFQTANAMSGRGMTISLLVLDKFDKYEPTMSEALIQGIWPVVAGIPQRTILIVGSDPRFDDFYPD